MRKVALYLIAFMYALSPVHAAPPTYEEEDDEPGDYFHGEVYDSAASTAVSSSMITWGLGIAAGITALTLLIKESSTKKSKGGGGGSHSHTHS